MASPALGKLEEYQPGEERFSSYIERVHIFFAANEVAAAKQVPVLLSVIGSQTYTILRDLLAPVAPMDTSLKDITAALAAHFEPKSFTIVERYHFHKRNQASSKSIADLVADLQRLASKCDFGDYLDEALRDRFVCGVHNEAIQRRLLTESKLTFTNAVEIAKSMEAAQSHTQSLKASPATVDQVHATMSEHSLSTSFVTPAPRTSAHNDPPPLARYPCHCCGSNAHMPAECGCKNLQCYKCGKIGHLERVCRSRGRGRQRGGRGRGRGRSTMWVNVDQSDPLAVDEQEWDVKTVGSSNAESPYKVKVQLNGAQTEMEVDTIGGNLQKKS